MNPTDFTLQALSYILISGGSNPNATIANASALQLRRIATDLTAAMQDIHTLAPGFFRRPSGGILQAPSDITLSVTQNSSTVTYGGTIVNGQTIAIGGVHYQIFTEAGAKRLNIPYAGATDAAAGATLYGDAIALDADVSKVLDDVFILDGRRLHPRNNRKQVHMGVREFPDYGRVIHLEGGKPTMGETPLTYWVDTGLSNETAGLAERSVLRVTPIPTRQTSITFTALIRAPGYTVADLGTDVSASTKTIPIPDEYHESIVLPIFLAKWTASPWFKDKDAKKAILDDAREARMKLAEKTKQLGRSFRLSAPI